MRFFKEHIIGMIIFALITGIFATYLYDYFELKPQRTFYSDTQSSLVNSQSPSVFNSAATVKSAPPAQSLTVEQGKIAIASNKAIAKKEPDTWSLNRAKQAAQVILLKTDWAAAADLCKESCTVDHTFLNDFRISTNDGEAIILLYASNDRHNKCHGCAPTLSFFEFTKSENVWALSDSSIAFANLGQWGVVGKENAEVQKIGKSKFALILSGFYMGMGYASSSKTIYLFTEPGIREVLSIETSDSNGASGKSKLYSWTASMEIRPSNQEYFDIFVKTEGTKKKLHLINALYLSLMANAMRGLVIFYNGVPPQIELQMADLDYLISYIRLKQLALNL